MTCLKILLWYLMYWYLKSFVWGVKWFSFRGLHRSFICSLIGDRPCAQYMHADVLNVYGIVNSRSCLQWDPFVETIVSGIKCPRERIPYYKGHPLVERYPCHSGMAHTKLESPCPPPPWFLLGGVPVMQSWLDFLGGFKFATVKKKKAEDEKVECPLQHQNSWHDVINIGVPLRRK